MIRKLVGLFTKLIDKTEKIQLRDDEILNDFDVLEEEINLSDGAATFSEHIGSLYKWDDGCVWNEAMWS